MSRPKIVAKGKKSWNKYVVYSEELVDPRFAEVIAQEIPDGRVLILSPIEGIDSEEQAAGIGYLDKMRENIAKLNIGLKC